MNKTLFALTLLLSACVYDESSLSQFTEAFDKSTADLRDQVPEDQLNNAEDFINQAQKQNKADTAPQVPANMQPFNYKRKDLYEFLGQEPSSVVIGGKSAKLRNPKMVASFYANNGYDTVWTMEDKVGNLTERLKTAIANSSADALNPENYHYSTIQHLQNGKSYEDILSLELLMTDAWLSLAKHLANGLVNPSKAGEPHWNAKKVSDEELFALLNKAAQSGDINDTLQGINAGDKQYQALKASYASGKQEKIAISMERLRWLPQGWYKGKHVVINLPSFYATLYDGDTELLASKAVIGKPKTPTPRFVDTIRHVVLNPTWTMPESIKKETRGLGASYEVITPAGKVVSPSSVNWRAAGYTVRQKPGRGNALGALKILFPNKHSVYMHDTPSKGLFGNKVRAYSHGCVRLHQPREMATLLLEGTNWNRAKIDANIPKPKEIWINTKQVPVYLVYWTNTAKGSYGDLYGLDGKLLAAYKQANK